MLLGLPLMKRNRKSIMQEAQYFYSQGFSTRQVASRVGISNATVQRYTSSITTPESRKRNAGRPSILSKRVANRVVGLFECGVLKNITDTINYIDNSTGIRPGATTIAQLLRNCGLKSYSKPKKPRLTKVHKKNRHSFARLMKSFPEEAWKAVIFTDECKISKYGPDGNKHVWQKPGAQLLDHHVIPTVKFGGGSVMVWGVITYYGAGKLLFINSSMNSELYVAILELGYAGTLEMHGFDFSSSILQQENDPKHPAKYIKA